MGLFNDFFRTSNSSNAEFSLETLLSLVTNSISRFDKIRIELEKIIFFNRIVSFEIPIEYQKEAVEFEQEYKDRYIISTGIISLAIVEYLVNKRSKNIKNVDTLNQLKWKCFSNILVVRKKIILRNLQPELQQGYSFFYDNELEIIDNSGNKNRFSLLITNLSEEIKGLIEQNSNINHTRNYFGVRMGQIFAENLTERNEEVGDLIKTQIKITCKELEKYFFNQL